MTAGRIVITFALALLLGGQALPAAECCTVKTTLTVCGPIDAQVFVNGHGPTYTDGNQYTFIWNTLPKDSYGDVKVDLVHDGVTYRKVSVLYTGTETTMVFADVLSQPLGSSTVPPAKVRITENILLIILFLGVALAILVYYLNKIYDSLCYLGRPCSCQRPNTPPPGNVSLDCE